MIMNADILANERKNRYNDWGERQPIVNTDSEMFFAVSRVKARDDLTEAEKSAIYLHGITGCNGLEFVGFSNAKIERPISLLNGIILYPCFLQSTGGQNVNDPIVRTSMRMSQTGRYIYDGWLPIKDMCEESIRASIRVLRETLCAFSLVSGSKFDWEPKYKTSNSNEDTHYYAEKEIKTIEEFLNTIESIAQDDREALIRSIGWLSECIRVQNPESKFLFAVLSIEALCAYIEGSGSDSILNSLAQEKKTKATKKSERNDCIRKILNDHLEDSPTRAISSAYFGCVVGIKKKLIQHLTNVFDANDEDLVTFFEKQENEFSLYELRHTIAHGSHDIISEIDLARITKNAFKVERFATRYIWRVLNIAFDFFNESSSINAKISMDFGNSVISDRSMYKGPVDMGLIYVK